jgi:hypothetical protein
VGQVVHSGEVLAQVAPKDAPRTIVAFLPSREVAFVSVGSEAEVHGESLPDSELGMARARITRLAAEGERSEESTSPLGENAASAGAGASSERPMSAGAFAAASGESLSGSHVSVELELLDDAAWEKMAPHLRSGERLLVRLHSRERRVLSVAVELVRKWLET